jgi:Protein of unknown function (DUF3500)
MVYACRSCVLSGGPSLADTNNAEKLMTSTQIADKMTAAAEQWLASLSREQRPLGHWRTPSADLHAEERMRWFYTPTDHGGLTVGEQRPHQQQHVMRLLSTALSDEAYVSVVTIMGLENILDRLEGWSRTWGRDRGRDPGAYWLRVFGEPGGPLWAWRFGGHHISLNFVISNQRIISTTPNFLGADPASAPLPGDGFIRPLGATEDLARNLMRSLSDDQQHAALLHSRAPADIVTGNRPLLGEGATARRLDDDALWRHMPPDTGAVQKVAADAEAASGYSEDDYQVVAITGAPKGLAADDLEADQLILLRWLIGAYVDRVRPEASTPDTNIDELVGSAHFAWAGQIGGGRPLYYRVQGPRLLIEYANTAREGNHAHSVWRDPVTDFGMDVLREHYRR